MITVVAGAEEVFYFTDDDAELYKEDLVFLANEIKDFAQDLPSRGPDLHLVEKKEPEETAEEEPQDQECPEPQECIESEAGKRIYRGDIQLDAREQYQRLTSGEGSFEDALHAVRNGLLVCRQGWNGKGMWIEWQDGLYDPSKDIQIEPFIVMKTADEKYVAWLCSVSDMTASDWMILGVAKEQIPNPENERDIVAEDELKVFLELLVNPSRFEHLGVLSFMDEQIGIATGVVRDYYDATKNRNTYPCTHFDAFMEIYDSGTILDPEDRAIFRITYGRAVR